MLCGPLDFEMKARWLCFCCWFCFFGATPCLGAGAGVLTFLDGNARLLRGTTWYGVVEGIRIQPGDIVEAADGAQVQVELPGLASVNFMGPASLYAVSLAAPD